MSFRLIDELQTKVISAECDFIRLPPIFIDDRAAIAIRRIEFYIFPIYGNLLSPLNATTTISDR